MIRLHQILCSLDQKRDEAVLKAACAKKLGILTHDIVSMRIYRESIDARKDPICFSYIIDVSTTDDERLLKRKGLERTPDLSYHMPIKGTKHEAGTIVVAGFGPAGMFAALLLAQMGYRPLVVERGAAMDERIASVSNFWQKGKLDPCANVQFGEGGAGTFSDGKLTTRSKDLRSRKVLEELVRFGAPEDILYESHPHIGTDRLRDIVVRLRQEIIRLGGEVRFHSELNDIIIKNGKIEAVSVNDAWIPCKALILAVGHSARNTFEMLHKHTIAMEQKAFAIGVRVEHPQTLINRAQYKEYADHPNLKAAEYRLTYTTRKQRGVYTFCMCPGGSVVASARENGGIVVNGMSEHARDRENANSAVLVQVHPHDVGADLLDGVRFQRNLEQAAYACGEKPYYAPVQRMQDFMKQRASTQIGNIKPSILPGYTLCDMHTILPQFVRESLLEAFPVFDRKLHGFLCDDAILTGVETRSSSPLRILRDHDDLTSLSLKNCYPCGEGAGYAGGIVSAAIDGLRCAEQIIRRFQP